MLILRRMPFFVLLIIYLTPFIALAADCPTTVKTALDTADQVCADTGRNQVCYGNIQLEAVARDSTQKLTFDKPGDKVDVGALQSLKLSSMQRDSNQWGVALMKVQANIPDSLPGQNVTLLLFGNAELTPTGSSAAKLQAFTFKSSLNSTPCSEAPNGLLIQSPVGGQRVALTINGADFDIGSTVFISSEPGEGENTAGTGMSISTLAGIVRITALGQTVTSVEGTATGVGLNNNLQPVEPPEVPAPLKADELSPLLKLVQSNKSLLTPLAADAAANTTIADLIAQGLLPPINGDNPVIAIDPDKLNDATQKANEALNPEVTPHTGVTAGKYKISFDVGAACPNPELLPAAKSTILKVSDDGSISLNLNDKDQVFTHEGYTYSYQSFSPKGIVLIDIDKVTSQQLTGSYIASDTAGKACVATLSLDLTQ